MTDWRNKLREEMNDMDTATVARSVDSLLNYETVKYFNAEQREADHYSRAARRYANAAVRSENSLAWLNVGQSFITNALMAGAMGYTVWGWSQGRFTTGDVVFVNTLLAQLFRPLDLLGMVYRTIRQGLTDMGAMFDLIDTETEVKDAPGAGKSTLARLLFRFYDVTGGRITIDGQDLRDVTQASLRAGIGIVPQDSVLFNDTIGYNIGYGRDGAGQEDVESAARGAQIHNFIAAQPRGYDTQVGERGLKLSGGEKQRVAIARTLLKDPPILILDEATSALDSRTEADIQETLAAVSERRTTIVIAHRLSTIIDADEIIVLEAGRVAERGTHASLLKQGGLYADMWARQQAEDDEESDVAAE